MTITSTSAPSAADATSVLVRAAVAAALVGTAVVHLLLGSTYGQGSVVVGAAFVVGGLVSLVAAGLLLLRDSDAAWDLAAAVAAAMLVGLLVSATVGLFGIQTPTLEAPHLVSIVTEVSIIVAWAATRLRRG